MKRSGLERKFTEVSLAGVEADGTFCGYASLFGIPDLGRDSMERGAFAASLQRRGASGIRMLYQHDPTEPIGHWLEICEDHRGLHVCGRLTQGVARAREALELMRAGALDGLSIGFRTVRSTTEPGTRIRRILEADLWEISVVTFPMLPGARVSAVKSLRPPAIELAELIRKATILLKEEKRNGTGTGTGRTRTQVGGGCRGSCGGLPRIHGRLRDLQGRK